MDKEIIKLATAGKYTEFSEVIKEELKTKLSNHEVMKKYSADIDQIKKHKEQFKTISGE